MFYVSQWLDFVKDSVKIDSDYRLAKVSKLNSKSISNYRVGRSLPDEVAIEKLCKLSGEDPDVISAQLQSMRARTEEGRKLWERVARRLSVQGYRLEVADS